MEQTIFYQLSSVMVIVAIIALIARLLRQPLVIAYIFSGIVVGPSVLNLIHDRVAFESFSTIGITLLLFIIGLGLNVATIKSAGRAALVTFMGNAIGMTGLGFIAARLLGFGSSESLILGVSLVFSSTIIVIKALNDKKEQSRLYGQIATGILLAEDLLATIALILVAAGGQTANGTTNELLSLIVRGLVLGGLLVLTGGYIMPRLSRLFASSQELLYVFAIAWAFGISSLFHFAGLSIEVGALFAGVTLASLPYVQAIGSRLKPLRDFFLVLFFIKMGENIHLDQIAPAFLPALCFAVLVMAAKPLLVMLSLGWQGYTKQTVYKTAVHLSQISEFSVVLIVLAQSTGLAGQQSVNAITLTALITIAMSAYFMKYADSLYIRFQGILGIFERARTKREVQALGGYPFVLIGYHQGGRGFIETFRQMKKRYVVIDYSPEAVDSMERQHINHIYGDATDTELLDEIGVHKSELVISTLSDAATNTTLARYISGRNPEAVFICHAGTFDDANELYQAGASYVIVAPYVGNEHLNNFIRRNGSNKTAYDKYKRRHLLSLGRMIAETQAL